MQEFTRADELYQAGMKVDPQNANLLVHRGIVKLQSVGESIQGGIRRSDFIPGSICGEIKALNCHYCQELDDNLSHFQETFPRPWS